MKRASYALAAAALAFAVVPAGAADLPVYKAPPAPVVVDPWTGLYVGLNIGYSWGRSETTVGYFTAPGGVPIVPPPGSVTAATLDLDGLIGGAQIGYNWLLSNNLVLGVEADFQLSAEDDDAGFLCAATVIGGPCLPGFTFLPAGVTGTSFLLSQHLVWFATLRARLGLLLTPKMMAYVTGGLAIGRIDSDATLAGLTLALVPTSVTASASETNAGWTVGIGLEGFLSENWTGKIEYLYMDLGSVSGSVTNLPIGLMATYNSDITDHVLRIGLNYHFDR